MIVNRCIGCMEETEAYPCSHCGFTPESYDSPAYSLKPNTILNGRYLVGKMLGQGGFGITYIGLDLETEQKIAIKEFFPFGQVNRLQTTGTNVQWSANPQTQELRRNGLISFKREAEKMAKLDSVREVVQVHEVFAENETAYIVMDFVAGETLKAKLMKDGIMPWAKARDVFLPVISAMERVHQAGLVHRDISPDNLMLDDDYNAKILDLGAAKDLTSSHGASSVLVAKDGFSPLEQYGQRGGSGSWTDVYAMAATMYYTLTGTLPPVAVDRLENDSIKWDLPEFLALPENVQNALKHALAVSVKERTPDMKVFYEELFPVSDPIMMDDMPTTGSADTGFVTGYADSKAVTKKRSKAPVFIGVLAVAAVAALLVVYLTSCTFGHHWIDATCTSPAVCSRCGEENGEPLPHQYLDPTCTDPQICALCGEAYGVALGHDFVGGDCVTPGTCSRCGLTDTDVQNHDWMAATYTAPMTCSRCGATEGNVKGYLGTIEGSWSKEIQAIGNPRNKAYNLDQVVEQCHSMTLKLTLVTASGWYQGPWRIWFHDPATDRWLDLIGINIPADSVGQDQYFSFEFPSPATFDGVAVAPVAIGNCSWTLSLGVEDVQVFVD